MADDVLNASATDDCDDGTAAADDVDDTNGGMMVRDISPDSMARSFWRLAMGQPDALISRAAASARAPWSVVFFLVVVCETELEFGEIHCSLIGEFHSVNALTQSIKSVVFSGNVTSLYL